MLLGVPVSFGIMVVVLIGTALIIDPFKGPLMVVSGFYDSLANFNLAPVPLFVLAGSILLHSGLALRAIQGLGKIMGYFPASFSYLTIASGTLFGAISGSTLASNAILTSVILPEMRSRGYSKALSFGPILASGGLAMIIPPSALAVVYAAIAQISVGDVLIAGFIPGLLMAIAYVIVIKINVMLNPNEVPQEEVTSYSWRERLNALFTDILPISLVVLLMGLCIFLGITTPTEAAAVGVVGALLLTVFYKILSWELIIKSIKEAVDTTGMIFFIVLAADGFSRLLAMGGISSGLLRWVTSLDLAPIVMVIGMILVVIVMGTLMDQVAIMMVTIPFFTPIINYLGFDPIWFAILMLIALSMGLTTPPFGLGLFIVKSLAPSDTQMSDLYTATIPYLVSNVAILAILIAFPILVTVLPNLMAR